MSDQLTRLPFEVPFGVFTAERFTLLTDPCGWAMAPPADLLRFYGALQQVRPAIPAPQPGREGAGRGAEGG